jgi:hypothetical protein
MRTTIGVGLMLSLGACVSDASSPAETEDEEGNTASVSQAETLQCPAPFAAQLASVKYDKELIITNTAVVDDKCRTVFQPTDPSCTNPSVNGKWSFWHLMTQLAGTNNVSRFVLKWLESFEETPTVNGQNLQARPKIRPLIIDAWRQKSGCPTGLKYDDAPCELKPAFAPFRLLAIVNRVDLRVGGAGTPGSTTFDMYGNPTVIQGSGGDAGEGRFVFGFTDINSPDANSNPNQLQATVIFEFKIPTSSRAAIDWAKDWRALGNFASFDASYRSALQTITDRFTKSGVMAGNPNNGNALGQLRTDEFDFDPNNFPTKKVWSMREFKLACLPGQSCGLNDKFLINTTTAQTPQNEHNETPLLDSFLTSNQASILNGTHVVPATFAGVPFLAGDSRSPSAAVGPIQWNRSDPNSYADPNVCTARRLYAFSTCNGCHYLETDNTGNLHIKNRNVGSSSVLSGFLTGEQIVSSNDPCEKNLAAVTYNEPDRRKCELLALAAGAPVPKSFGTGRPH